MGDPVLEAPSPRPRRKIGKNRRLGVRGGRINLDAMEDRAWLAGLIIGDGSIYAKGAKGARGKRIFCPHVSIAMCDKSAMSRAARLIGVSVTRSGKARITGRRLWRVIAVGTRALEVVRLVKPFLTETRISQAMAAIRKARESGFRTRAERKKRWKLRILGFVKLKPGSSTKRIHNETKLETSYLRRYLEELSKEGEIRSETVRAGSQLRKRWYIEDSAFPTSNPLEASKALDSVDQLSASHIINWDRKILLPEQRGREPQLQNLPDRAWLGGLTVSDGFIGTIRPKASFHCIPRLGVRMLDKEAVIKAAGLMGVAVVPSGKSKGSAKQFWMASAVGGRAIQIIDLIHPWLTPPKLRQGEKAIAKARNSGYRTMIEIQAAIEETILQYVSENPGSLTTEIVKATGKENHVTKKYLGELETKGRVRKVVGGTIRKPWRRWYPAQNAF